MLGDCDFVFNSWKTDNSKSSCSLGSRLLDISVQSGHPYCEIPFCPLSISSPTNQLSCSRFYIMSKSEWSVIQSCPNLCDPMDCSLPGSSVHGILQARIQERGTIPFSRGSSRSRDRTHVSCTAGRFFFSFFFYHLSHQGNPMFRRGRAKFQTVSRKTMVKNKLVWWENKEPDKN